jgi:hypothetical protein
VAPPASTVQGGLSGRVGFFHVHTGLHQDLDYVEVAALARNDQGRAAIVAKVGKVLVDAASVEEGAECAAVTLPNCIEQQPCHGFIGERFLEEKYSSITSQ